VGLGFAVPHLRQEALRAKFRSPQPGQFQSPGMLCLANPDVCAALGSGFGVPHFLHEALRTKLKSPQLGQVQSPGPGVNVPWNSVGSGFAVPHLRHTLFRAKFRSPQLGQFQSPFMPPPCLASPVSASITESCVPWGIMYPFRVWTAAREDSLFR